MPPSPNNHKKLVAFVVLLVKITVSGAWQEPTGLPVNCETGAETMLMVFVIESLHPPKLLTSFTSYVPVELYVLNGLSCVEVVPSPKYQVILIGAGDEVFTKLTGLFIQPVAGEVKFALAVPIFTALVRMSVSLHPLLFDTIKRMV